MHRNYICDMMQETWGHSGSNGPRVCEAQKLVCELLKIAERPFMLQLVLKNHMEWKTLYKHTHLPLSQLLQFWRGREGEGGGGEWSGRGRCGQKLLTGKVVLQGSEEVTDDRHTPRLPQHLLPLLPVHVPHIGVMFGETKDPGEEWGRRYV